MESTLIDTTTKVQQESFKSRILLWEDGKHSETSNRPHHHYEKPETFERVAQLLKEHPWFKVKSVIPASYTCDEDDLRSSTTSTEWTKTCVF